MHGGELVAMRDSRLGGVLCDSRTRDAVAAGVGRSHVGSAAGTQGVRLHTKGKCDRSRRGFLILAANVFTALSAEARDSNLVADSGFETGVCVVDWPNDYGLWGGDKDDERKASREL